MDRIRYVALKSLLSFILLSFISSVSAADDDWWRVDNWWADKEPQTVIVADAFIEFHTGPGRGFPVFHIEEKGQVITLIKKKTQWFKVRSNKGHEGWVHEDTMEKTLVSGHENFDSGNQDQTDFTNKSWEAGVLGGDFGGATSLTMYGGWDFTQNLSGEIAISQALGNVSDIRHINFSLLHQPFPEWRVSPFFKLGAGIIQTRPSSSIILPEDRTDEIVNVGVGIKAYVSRQFFIRAEYTSYTILTSRNDNDEVNEWKLGFSVFF